MITQEPRSLNPVGDAQLFIGSVQVVLNRPGREVQLLRDLLVAQTAGGEAQDFKLARRQAVDGRRAFHNSRLSTTRAWRPVPRPRRAPIGPGCHRDATQLAREAAF